MLYIYMDQSSIIQLAKNSFFYITNYIFLNNINKHIYIFDTYTNQYFICTINNNRITCNCNTSPDLFCVHICYFYTCHCNIDDSILYDTGFLNNNALILIDYLFRSYLNDSSSDSSDSDIPSPNITHNTTINFYSTNYDYINTTCPICLNPLTEQSVVVKCPKCMNVSHTLCMHKWLEEKNTCIICRSDVWKEYKK